MLGGHVSESDNCECRVLLAVLCGLPASGKSYLSRLICEKHGKSVDSVRFSATIVVCYDRLLPAHIAQQLINGQDHHVSGSLTWKQYRDIIVASVNTLVCEILGSIYSELDADIPNDVPVDEVQKLVENILRKDNAETFLKLNQLNATHSSRLRDDHVCSNVIFIIDDNMYFKSMRYDYYRLARKYNIGFCQLYVRCDVETALRRNRLRTDSGQNEHAVENHVIRDMWDKFEPPNPISGRIWETMSMEFETSVNDHFQSCWSSLDNFLCSALNSTVHTIDSNEKDKTSSSFTCNQSTLHQVDRVLRTLISEAIQADFSNSTNFKAEKLNSCRREIMDDVKKGVLVIEESLKHRIENHGDNMDSAVTELYRFLKQIFNVEDIIKFSNFIAH